MARDRTADAIGDAALEEDAELLYDEAPCGYLSTTPEGRVVKVNATFCTWLGFAREELLGRHLIELLTSGARIFHETHYAPMLQMQGFVREIAVDVLRADGSRLPVLLNATLVRSSAGEPQLVRVALFDARERREYERELVRARDAALAAEARAAALARTLSSSFIPPTPPEVPGLEIASAYRPAGDGTEVGGDFYDVFPAGPSDWVVALGDVSGKGVEAAVVTSVARNSVRALTVLGQELDEVLSGVNQVVHQHETEKFCTLVALRMRRDGDGWRTTVAVGGHPLPLLLRPGCEPRLVGSPGTLIGLLPESTFAEESIDLRPGDTLVLYSDGVTEARDDRDYFGDERLLAWGDGLETNEVDELVDGLLREVLAYQGGLPRDDIAIVAVRYPEAEVSGAQAEGTGNVRSINSGPGTRRRADAKADSVQA